MRYTTRPLSDRTWLRPDSARIYSQFDSPWSKTQAQLAREIEHLGGSDVVIEVDVPERGIRNDGMLRADAKAATPAVVVAFESKHGPMLYRSDRYVGRYYDQGPDWQQNVRAVTLTLEALRAVDRYGATETGQQYAGFKALPAGRAMPASHMTRDQAAEIIRGHGPVDSPSLEASWKAARAATHPDRNGGEQAAWDRVEEAASVLGLTR